MDLDELVCQYFSSLGRRVGRPILPHNRDGWMVQGFLYGNLRPAAEVFIPRRRLLGKGETAVIEELKAILDEAWQMIVREQETMLAWCGMYITDRESWKSLIEPEEE